MWPFLYRVFLDQYQSLGIVWELIFRTVFIYSYALINIRIIMDKRALSQLSPFQLIIIIALGAAIGDPMVYPQIPLINCMIVIPMILLLEKGTSSLLDRSQLIEKIIMGQPSLLIKDGMILVENLHKNALTKNELFSQLRAAGVKNVGEVAYAFLETSGQVSVLRAERPLEKESTLVG